MSQELYSNHRAEIVEVVHRYAYCIRSQQASQGADLFTEDGVFEIRAMDPRDADSLQVREVLVGREAIRDYVVKVEGYGLRVCPLIFNAVVEVDGATATCNSIMESRTWPAGHEVIGEYHDCFRREGQQWLIQSRVFTIFQSQKSPGAGSP